MSEKRARFNLWGPAILLLVGLMGGVALTLWGINTFGPQKTAPESIGQVDQVDDGHRQTQPASESGRGVPGQGVQPEAKAIRSTVSQDGRFRFELLECRYQDMTVVCALRVTNETENDIDFIVATSTSPWSQIHTDAFGAEFNASSAQIGMRQGWQPQQTLVRKTPTYLELRFGDDFNRIPQSKLLRRLKVGYSFLTPEIGRWEKGDVHFHDVPLQ